MSDSGPNTTPSTVTKKLKKPIPTHDELRDRWVAASGGNVVFARGDFHRYEHGAWSTVEISLIRQEIQRVIEQAKCDQVRPTAGLLASVVTLAQARCARSSHLFDANANLLACENGTLEVDTRTLREHRKKDYLTTRVPYAYDPNAAAPNWDRFLVDLDVRISAESKRPEAGGEVVDFLREFVGYSATTDCRHEIAIWLHSPPGWGKSTFIEGVQAALADRCVGLGLAEIERSRFALASLPGKTLAIATEQPSNFVNSSDILNRLISGESIYVERKFQDSYEIRPTVKLLWAMNDLPRVTSPDSGIFRRVKVVSWPRLDKANADPDLKERIKTEGPGILNWALVGLERLLERGRFQIPAEVSAATKQFQTHNDIPALFLAECAELDKTGVNDWRMQTSDLYFAYRNWCADHGHRPKSSTSIAEDWKRLDLAYRKIGGERYWYGAQLNALANTDPPRRT